MKILIKADVYNGGYSPSQVNTNRTMTVRDLINELEDLALETSDETPVIIESNDRGYNCMSISEVETYNEEEED